MFLPNRITHIRDINQRRILKLFLRVMRGVLKIAFIQLEQRPVNGLAVIRHEQPVHVLLTDSRVYRVVDYLVEVVLVDEDQQLAL
jgi:hypothetical protein